MVNFMTAPRTAAHRIVVPYFAPATEATTRSPAPRPVAAMTRPGPMSRSLKLVFFMVSLSADFPASVLK